MKQHSRVASLVVSLMLPVMLAACADPGIDALDRELADIRRDPVATRHQDIPAMPVQKPPRYDAQDSRSPFQPREAEGGRERPLDSLLMPELDRPREPLEAYDLRELALVGTLRVGGQPSALVRAPGGQVHRVRIGNYLGLDHGRIVEITGTSVQLVELVVERSGWTERSRQLSLDT